MAIIKCKMCGGDIELAPDKTFGTCDSCGSTMTFPKLDDEQRAAAFNRGNHFRRIGEFDKALAVYERIVREDDTDAEAHWCCALCRFGIEYVEDPATYEWLPTCHRASFDSFLEDVDYLAAIEHSDGITRRQYQKDAAKIAEVQRGILATSQNTEPYDVFICYKESDENGDRTRDSLLAQDIYYQLTEQGRKVFFARITLEDVVGSQYEPHIFAALNSAKVMIVVGTKPEYLNAVWVKNEWSRFLALMKKDHHKLLLPCYRDMDPYDMPEQLSILQSYDMGKIGFIQDLIRGIAKVLDADKKPEPVKETVVVNTASTATAPLLKRAFMFLEDGDFESADEYCEKVLDQDPENAQAYLGKLMVRLKIQKREKLQDLTSPFDNEDLYRKALRFADPDLKKTLADYNEHIRNRNYTNALKILNTSKNLLLVNTAAHTFASLGNYKDSPELVEKCKVRADELATETAYQTACTAMSNASTEDALLKLSESFRALTGYKDSEQLAAQCKEKAALLRKDDIYKRATQLAASQKFLEAAEMMRSIPGHKDADAMAKSYTDRDSLQRKIDIYAEAETARKRAEYAKARDLYRKVSGYRDADNLAQQCQQTIDAQAAYRKRRRQTEKALKAGAIVAAVGLVVFLILLFALIIPGNKYKKADALCAKGDYLAAAEMFENLKKFKDSPTRYKDAMYKYAGQLSSNGEIAKAAMTFGSLEDFKDARQQSFAMWDQVAVRETVSAGSYHTVALKNDGTVVATQYIGNYYYNQCEVADWTDIIAVSAGDVHTVGLMRDGTVVAVGSNHHGQCDVSYWKDIVAIYAGVDTTVGLKMDGTVVATGGIDNYAKNSSKTDTYHDWTDIVAVAAGGSQVVGLKSDGTVVSCGNGYNGKSEVGEWTDIIAISMSGDRVLGLKADGTVLAAGTHQYDAGCHVEDWSDIVAISARGHSLGLKADGTLVAVGDNDYDHGQSEVAGINDIIAIDSGLYHAVVMKSDGSLLALGHTEYGQCDVSGWTDIKVPQK